MKWRDKRYSVLKGGRAGVVECRSAGDGNGGHCVLSVVEVGERNEDICSLEEMLPRSSSR